MTHRPRGGPLPTAKKSAATPRTTHPEHETRHATTYQASRGGYFPEREKPVPGTPKQED